ncbi:unnamed protein product [Caenorhabditis bovis]|uniref:F-box associated domain-containing protein n=1 Tax=Caenorhabditis bovis TaxID=2654633 RepID=A0A8S1FF08_9PELO|nr:unnamed protein product [Caenorhabditis bovis]
MLFEDCFDGLDLSAEDDPPFESNVTPCRTLHRWCKLPLFAQQHAITFMDSKTRIALSMCSKKMNEIVEMTAGPPIHRLEIKDTETFYCYDIKDTTKTVEMNIEFKINKIGSYRPIIFAKRGNNTELIRPLNSRFHQQHGPVIFENADYYDKAIKLFEKLLKRSNNVVYDCLIEMENWDIERSSVKQLNKCKSFQFAFNSLAKLRYALDLLTDQVVRLNLIDQCRNFESDSYGNTITAEILAHRQIQNVDRFDFYANCNFTEELLMSLKGTHITFTSSTINDDIINKFIKRWVDGGGPEGFTQLNLRCRRDFKPDAILRNVNFRIWDSEFENERLVAREHVSNNENPKFSRGFCGDFYRVMGRGMCAQITRNNQLKSATLRISDDSLLFTVTGSYWPNYKCFGYTIPI